MSLIPVACTTRVAKSILTPEEREWLREHDGRIRLGTEYIYDLYNADNEGVYNGVAADYIKLIEEKLSCRFQIVRIDNWFEENQKVAAREVDVLNSLAGSTRLSKYMLFTPPYFTFPAYIVTRNEPDAPAAPGLLNGRTILYLENEDLETFLRGKFPGATIRMAMDPMRGLQEIAENRGDAIILSQVMATFYMKKTGIASLQVGKPVGYMFKSSIASRNDWPILNRILAKGLAMIGESEREMIQRKWGLKKYFWNSARFWNATLAILSIVILIILATLLWNHTLRRKVKRQTAEMKKELEERKQMQSALLASENRYQQLADATFEAILLLENGRIADLNPQAGLMLGYEKRDALLVDLLDLVPASERDKVGSYLQSRAERPCEFHLRRRDGSEITVESRMKTGGEGGRQSRFMVLRDITERIRAEKEMQRQQEELFQADKMISLGILVSGMAHEINNPNNSIALNAALLKDAWKSIHPILAEYYRVNPDLTIGGFVYEQLEEVLPRVMDSLLKNSQRIQSIVDSLKDFSRRDSEIGQTPMDINRVLAEAIQLLVGLIADHTRRFEVVYGKGIPPMDGSKQKIEQVAINLIQNACLALPDRERGIRVTTRHDKENNRIILSVHDEGTGIAEKDMKYILEPFFTTRRADGGVGLGLFITKRIVDEHRGTLHFESTPGQGTTVMVSFPVADPDGWPGEKAS